MTRSTPDSAPPSPARVLIADDQPDVLEALRLLLKVQGFQLQLARSPAEILAAIEGHEFDAVLIDLNYTRDTTSGHEGLDLLGKIAALDATLPVLVMTAWGSVEGAVDAVRRGARDYIQKPWDNARLLTTLRTQIDLARAQRRTGKLEGENERLRGRAELPELVAGSKAMAPILRVLERIAPSDAAVLITGEHGTGKEVVARWLHAASRRAARPFVAVNAGALGEGVFESELFGHVKGAFTDAKTDRIGCFELADGGTLFLDEIANMPAAQQAKLLRVLQTGELHRVGSSKLRKVDVRVLAATNAPLEQLTAGGAFREDLLYRLNTVEVHLPPLRERKEDILRLAEHFLRAKSPRYGGKVVDLDASARQALLEHRWPGNVRELEHVIERALLLTGGSAIGVEDLALRGGSARGPVFEDMTLEQAERHLIAQALARCNNNVSEAAQRLGLSRSAFYRRMARYGLEP
ncbi:DNA-binding transcriptional response regulator, NtrC family, contains REC, AAA-type ATPase, and a Fis-type DNA-binding domains [Nannocystis exedens]|uniref:DNA-binding transcriptional response regulator, NtrC family, contains REC, AAA-type ATPase, and a Fis-type DNA-binding domains n=1 Tax=Nannocystis exedens TaxID=54 RepID=A0A1I2GTU3_9BACT|nr:sigma-54 dependent transcriptional regulator [Nannocystis exedens]PCC74090.1 sigma-54-dependent Fis family transcriptional regulator [Nannocystis exedens]SFF20882.1 DNA-binding transcriptional response regulator, NtrC family, contains REC, AAA-type ATPase, and a Fis-type DNA-binding domains [Nannocystis exedens]